MWPRSRSAMNPGQLDGQNIPYLSCFITSSRFFVIMILFQRSLAGRKCRPGSGRGSKRAESFCMRLKIDDWDSHFFKTRIARLILRGDRKYQHFHRTLSRFLAVSKKNDVRFLVIKLNRPAAYYMKVITDLGFRYCGEGVNLLFKFP